MNRPDIEYDGCNDSYVPESAYYSFTGELPSDEVDEYDDSAYFHEQLDEILAELRKLVKATGPMKVTVGEGVDAPTILRERVADIYGEYNPRVYDNIVRGSN